MGACHHDDPGLTGPIIDHTIPALVIRSARPPHDPVPGATVSIDGIGTFVTDTDGTVILPDVDARQVLSIVADGFVEPHVTMLYQALEGTVYLLPDDHDLPWPWLYEAYYASNEHACLWRPEPGIVHVEASREIQDDSFLRNALEWGIGTVNEAQPYVSYVLTDTAGAVRVYRNPDDPIFRESGYEGAWAVAFQHRSGGTVIGGRIVFKFFVRDAVTQAHLHQAMAHELAHLTALNGHAPGGLMTNWDVHEDFSQNEKLAMRMAFLRPAGTRPPDNAAGALIHSSGPTSPGLKASGGVEEVVVCVVRQ
jgi:hypothetical protein